MATLRTFDPIRRDLVSVGPRPSWTTPLTGTPRHAAILLIAGLAAYLVRDAAPLAIGVFLAGVLYTIVDDVTGRDRLTARTDALDPINAIAITTVLGVTAVRTSLWQEIVFAIVGLLLLAGHLRRDRRHGLL